MDFHPQDVIISLINIVVLFVLLRLILWKHVVRFLSEREGRVRREKDDAEQKRLDAEALHDEYDKKIGEIEEHGRELMRDNQAKANAEADRIIKETHEKARVIIDEAEARIVEEKDLALENSREEITQLATEMASRILAREVSADDNKSVVDEFFR
ncbi:MAG: ATP synthase F0 subunit B [Oscillospiraceae bacterium]|nr:ATP synthase F0 subunit B [Oscillospiraceae bacterium]